MLRSAADTSPSTSAIFAIAKSVARLAAMPARTMPESAIADKRTHGEDVINSATSMVAHARAAAVVSLCIMGCAAIAGVEDGELAADAGAGGSGGVGGSAVGGSSGSGGTAPAGGASGAGASGASGAAGAGGGSGGVAGAAGGGAGGSSSGSKYADEVLADQPIAYLRLGESSGTVAVDLTGNGHDGLLKGGVTLGAAGALVGDTDTAMYFDGTTYVDLGDELDMSGTSQFTLEAWIHPQAGNGGYLGKSMYDQGYKGYFVADNDSTIQFVREGAAVTPPVIAFTQYTHVVGTYDGLNLILYLNGAKAGSDTATNVVTDHPNPFTIGQVGGWGDFVGFIDEVAIYDTALTEVRIKAHYDAAKGN
jgi:hypothetical protein